VRKELQCRDSGFVQSRAAPGTPKGEAGTILTCVNGRAASGMGPVIDRGRSQHVGTARREGAPDCPPAALGRSARPFTQVWPFRRINSKGKSHHDWDAAGFPAPWSMVGAASATPAGDPLFRGPSRSDRITVPIRTLGRAKRRRVGSGVSSPHIPEYSAPLGPSPAGLFREKAAPSFPPPAFCECRNGGLAGCSIAVGGRAISRKKKPRTGRPGQEVEGLDRQQIFRCF
jgi:hypothetical protein